MLRNLFNNLNNLCKQYLRKMYLADILNHSRMPVFAVWDAMKFYHRESLRNAHFSAPLKPIFIYIYLLYDIYLFIYIFIHVAYVTLVAAGSSLMGPSIIASSNI